MSTRIPARVRSATIRRVASRPSTPGMRMSISTTSGRFSLARLTASSPLAASATISISLAELRSTLKPARTSA